MFHFMKIHTVPAEKEGSTWLQLFFDLVYVAILVELGNQLSHDLTLEGVGTFILLLIPIWWSWLEFVEYGRRFPVDDIGQRILTLLYMAFMLVMAFEIHSLTVDTLTIFFFTYGIAKFVLSLMYGRAWIYYPTYRRSTSNRAVAYAVVGIIWMAIATIAPANIWFWVLLVLFGALAPALIHYIHALTSSTELPLPPIKYRFTLHRFGELTIIVLGEFFIKLVTSSAGRELTPLNYLVGAGLLAISVSLWWLYFDHLEHANLAKASTRLWFWTYSHFPFLVAITAYGVVGNQIFAATPQIPLDDTRRLLFTIALALALLAFGAIEWSSREKDEPLSRPAQPRVRLAGAAALLALGLFGSSLNVGWLVLLVVAILLLQVGMDVVLRLRRPDRELSQQALSD